jgi:hypothetical protein
MALAAVTNTDSDAVLRKTYAASIKSLLYGDDDRAFCSAR